MAEETFKVNTEEEVEDKAVKVEQDNIKVRVGGGFLSVDEFID